MLPVQPEIESKDPKPERVNREDSKALSNVDRPSRSLQVEALRRQADLLSDFAVHLGFRGFRLDVSGDSGPATLERAHALRTAKEEHATVGSFEKGGDDWHIFYPLNLHAAGNAFDPDAFAGSEQVGI